MGCRRGRDHGSYGPSPLEEVLRAREERSALRQALVGDLRRLSPYEAAVVQGGLNVPGWPKSLKGGMGRLMGAISNALEGLRWRELASLEDPLGPFLLAAVEADPLEVKGRCLKLEEELPWGRLLDLDVFDLWDPTKPIKRQALGFQERRCLMCPRPAKECAQGSRHHLGALRRRALVLWEFPQHFLQVFLPELEGQEGAKGAPRKA
ncbi:MAG: citrate lyase holo-[acyl-carrier protein] synthase [Thermanaerothrix sp.]|nr:citrate lyase holo-[acyl-carrier protein] synthase [Thermanaerothrix sp.]